MTQSMVARCVAEGAKLLDEVRPGWPQRVNLSVLNLDSGYNCVLGQVYGYYGRGVAILDTEAGHVKMTEEEKAMAGASFTSNHYYHEWVKVITAKQKALGKAS